MRAGWAGSSLRAGPRKPAENQALFSLLRDRFGGDGKTTFALPDLRDAAPENLGFFIAVQGLYPAFM